MPSLTTFHPQVALISVVPFCGSAVSSTARCTFYSNSISARICPHRLVCGGFLFALAHLLTFMLCFVCKTCMVVRFFVCKSVLPPIPLHHVPVCTFIVTTLFLERQCLRLHQCLYKSVFVVITSHAVSPFFVCNIVFLHLNLHFEVFCQV